MEAFIFILAVVILAPVFGAISNSRKQKQAAAHEESIRKEAMHEGFSMAQSFEKNSATGDIKTFLFLARRDLSVINSAKNVVLAIESLDLMRYHCKCAYRIADQHDTEIPAGYLHIAEMTDADRASMIQKILDRTLKLAVEDAATLKTERGQKNRIAAYFKKLSDISPMIPLSLFPWIQQRAAEYGVAFEVSDNITIEFIPEIPEENYSNPQE